MPQLKSLDVRLGLGAQRRRARKRARRAGVESWRRHQAVSVPNHASAVFDAALNFMASVLDTTRVSKYPRCARPLHVIGARYAWGRLIEGAKEACGGKMKPRDGFYRCMQCGFTGARSA